MTQENRTTRNNSSSGFTIIELALAIFICSGLLVMATKLIKSWLDKDAVAKNHQRLDTIQQALDNYIAKYNRLPCPASLTAAMGTPAFGRAPAFPCAGGGIFSATGRNGATDPYGTAIPVTGSIRIGAVPVHDLGLPDSYLANDSGFAYTYAVTLSETSAINPINPFAGAIRVVDQNGNSVLPPPTDNKPAPNNGTALYVVVDHGKDGKGTYTTSGAPSPTACVGAGKDIDNCNHYTANRYFRTAPFNTRTGANWFDDSIVYSTSLSVAPTCITVFGNSKTAGVSRGHDQDGVDAGIGAGWNIWMIFFEIFGFTFQNWFTIDVGAPTSAISPLAGAYCPDTSYHVVSGGCSMTPAAPVNASGVPSNGVNGPVSNIYGADIFVDTTPHWTSYGNYYHYQFVLPPLSHPALPNGMGIQGWECSGSSANGFQTQAYAVCCPG